MTNDYWRQLSERDIDIDRIVAGLHEVEMLEAMTPYANSKELYFPRITRALEQLPAKHWDAALSVFAAVVYVPKDFLSASMEYLWWAAQEEAKADGVPISAEADDVHIMEVDLDGLVPDFARQNALSARLNGNVHPRIPDVQRLRQALTDACSENGAARDYAVAQLQLAASKTVWIVLTDKALSGQSLLGDLKKITFAREILYESTGNLPRIYICAQIVTTVAERDVIDWLMQEKIRDVKILSALRLDDRARVGSKDCRLFSDGETHRKVLDLCNWFDEEYVARDTSLATFRARSKGSLALGYNATGITLVDHMNAPTNSLPLLWFNSEDRAARFEPTRSRPKYVGPFPRVHSRRGAEDPRWSESSLWQHVMNPATRARIVDRIES